MPDRESETARHWLAAGPGARRPRLAGGPERRRRSPGGCTPTILPPSCSPPPSSRRRRTPTPRLQDRYDLLMDLADAHRWRGAWADLLETVEQAIETADEMDDVRLLARASSAMTDRRAVAVGRPRRDPRHGRRGTAPGPGRAPRRGRRAALPGDARAGQRALLQRQLRGAPRPDRAGAGDGPAARRRRAGARRLRGRVRVAVAARHRRAAAGAGERGDGASPRGSETSGRSSWPRR